mgnify:CR=1 FL=1
MKKAMTLMLLMLVALFCNAQMHDPVKFTAQLKTGSTAEGEIVFSGKIQKGWHVYSTNLGSDGPIEASFHVDKKDGVELVGKLTPRGKEISEMDPMFGMKLRYFEHSVQFVQKVKFTKPNYTIKCYLEFGACNEEMCMPPTQVELHKQGIRNMIILEREAMLGGILRQCIHDGKIMAWAEQGMGRKLV